MDHAHKKKLQANDLEDALLGAKDYATSHTGQLKKYGALGGVAVVLAAVVFGWLSWRSNALATQLSQALGTFDAPLSSDPALAATGEKGFATTAERIGAARGKLAELAKSSPSSGAGEAASAILLGLDGAKDLSAARLDAVASFAQAEAGTFAAGVAASSYLDAKAAAGQAKDAIVAAKRFLDSSNPPLPKDVLVYKLGALNEKAGLPAEAKSYYQRLVSEFPDSPMRAEAQQKLAAL